MDATTETPPEGEATDPAAPESTFDDGPPLDDGPLRMPWHLKLVLAALALYLGWRAYEALVWSVDKVFS